MFSKNIHVTINTETQVQLQVTIGVNWEQVALKQAEHQSEDPSAKRIKFSDMKDNFTDTNILQCWM
jgi:hypothetical protein